jgi:hypothetical protein
MGRGIKTLKVHNKDSFHDSSDGVFPSIENIFITPLGCSLNTTTSTQGLCMYNK